MNILKDFGKGVLYIFAVPAYLLMYAVMAIVGLAIFLFQSVIYIIKFVTGRNMGTLTKEDKQGKEIVKRKAAELQGVQNPIPAIVVEPTPIQAPQNNYQQVEERTTIQPSHQVEAQPEVTMSRIEQQPIIEETPAIEAPKEPEQPEEPEKEEEPEEYNPRTSDF